MSGYTNEWLRTAACAWGFALLAACNDGSSAGKDALPGTASAPGSAGTSGADGVNGASGTGSTDPSADGVNGSTTGGASGTDGNAGSSAGGNPGSDGAGGNPGSGGADTSGPSDDAAADDSSADDSAVVNDDAAADDSSADDSSADDSSADDSSADDTVTDDSSADDSAVGNDDAAADDSSADDTAADDSSGSDQGPSLIGDVAISVPSQSFREPLAVELATSVSGAEIRYTTDGTLPSATSTLYDGAPIAITTTTELRARAFTGSEPSGFVSTALYIARSFDITSNLPILLLDGFGGGESTDKELYLRAAVMVFEPVDGTASLSTLPTLATRAGYHLRGQSSSTFEQTPYRIEFWDNLDQDVDHPLLGMPADGDWALIPPFYDRSLIRNPFTYTLGKDLGLQAPRTAFAEVYVNYEARALGEVDYLGIYWVSELIKNNKVRTDLKQLEATHTALPEISGGYIWKFEQYAAEEPSIECTGADPIGGGAGGFGGPGGDTGAEEATCWHSLELVDPDPINAEQQAWLTQHIQEFHDALHATPIGDYGAYIDLPSFVDYFLVTELSRNMDAYVRSAFYHKDRDGKIEAGPLWDYNFAFGAGSPNVVDPSGDWQVDAGRNVNNWYLKLLADPAFRAAVKARWQVVRQDQFSEASFDARIETLIAPLTGEAMVRDAAKWPMSWFIERAGRSTVPIDFPQQDTFEGQVQALKDFLTARLTRMDELIGAL